MIGLVLALALSRPYHPTAIASIATTHHTHVQISGTVCLVKREADGDLHFRVCDDAGHFVVCEIVPFHPLPMPTKGARVIVRGIRRYDDESPGHHWWEVHPVESWQAAK